MRRIVVIVTLAALAAPAQASGAVTIKVGAPYAKYRETHYGHAFRIKGKTGDYRGQVALEVDEFPYDGGGEIATAQTNEKGEYVFPKVKLSRNANLRIRAGSEFSPPLEVYVHPDLKVKVRRADFDHDRLVVTYTGHPGFVPPENALFVYLRKNGQKKVRRLGGTRRLTRIGDGRWRYDGLVRLPAGDYRYLLYGCVRGLAAGGYGRAYRLDRNCGNRTSGL